MPCLGHSVIITSNSGGTASISPNWVLGQSANDSRDLERRALSPAGRAQSQ